jgi:hypothetical protein
MTATADMGADGPVSVPTVTATTAPPVAFDSVGAGSDLESGTTISWTHDVVTAGAEAIAAVGIKGSATVSSVQFGGTTMTSAGPAENLDNTSGDGLLQFFTLADVPSGSQTVTVTISATDEIIGQSVAYTGVASVSATQNADGDGTSLSQTVDCTSGQMIVQAFAGNHIDAFTSVSGGTNRSNKSINALGEGIQLSVSDATASTTFTASSGSADWAGVAVVLSR